MNQSTYKIHVRSLLFFICFIQVSPQTGFSNKQEITKLHTVFNSGLHFIEYFTQVERCPTGVTEITVQENFSSINISKILKSNKLETMLLLSPQNTTEIKWTLGWTQSRMSRATTRKTKTSRSFLSGSLYLC